MAKELYANLATTTVSSGGTTAPSAGTSESWTVASSAPFPAAATGSAQFHVWDPAAPTEIATVTNVSGTTWTVTRGAEGTTPVAHSSGFTIWLVVTAADLATPVYQPWQFVPEWYGAAGDGKVISDAVLASNTTLTSASAAFTSADTGKTIMINGGAGTTSPPLVTTITYSNATTVTLGTAASVSGSAFVAVYGTDDTSAINTAVQAAGTYALANNYFAEVIFGAKIYMLASGPTQATSPQTNAQVVIPWPAVNGTSRKLVIALSGAGDAGFVQFWESLTPNVAGTVLMSTVKSAPSTPSGTYGNQSVIGGPSAGGAFTGGYANVKVVVKGIQVVSPAYTNQYAFDFGYCSAMRVQQSSAHIFAPAGLNGGNSPLLKDLPGQNPGFTGTIGVGLRSPVIANNDDIVVDDFTAEGYARGLYVFDHFTAGRVCTIYNDVSLVIDTTLSASGVSHGVFISLLSAEVYNGGILTHGSGGAYCPIYVNQDAEVSSPSYDVSDAGDVLFGVIHWTDPADTRAPTISGATNVKVVNDKLAPGQWTNAMTPAVPSVPGSTSTATNTAFRDATVYITSGGAAVTVIKVGGVTTGLTLGTSGAVTVRVPAGQTIALTYASTAPTWVWWLD